MKFLSNANEYLELTTVETANRAVLEERIDSSLAVLWFETDDNLLHIDGAPYTFHRGQMVCLTEFHKVEAISIHRLRLLRFNRTFFCIIEHDREVSCKGILFFGASQLPIVTIPPEELDKFETVWKMFVMEMESTDNLQLEMLQTVLKRYLILITRLYKQQCTLRTLDHASVDLVRELNYLVEQHFRTKHTVTEYARLLNKSPKTVSNVFSKMGSKSPLQYIQNRKMLEARRLLRYTDKSVKEIAYELGYEDIQAFSRFFKVQEHMAPSDFREKYTEGRIANSPGITA
jgi:AraC-like DNA-binding protein